MGNVGAWESRPQKCSTVELTQSLALLGFGSWTALEPSRVNIKKAIINCFLN